MVRLSIIIGKRNFRARAPDSRASRFGIRERLLSAFLDFHPSLRHTTPVATSNDQLFVYLRLLRVSNPPAFAVAAECGKRWDGRKHHSGSR